MAILYPTSLANLVVEVGTRHCHQTLLQSGIWLLETFSAKTNFISLTLRTNFSRKISKYDFSKNITEYLRVNICLKKNENAISLKPFENIWEHHIICHNKPSLFAINITNLCYINFLGWIVTLLPFLLAPSFSFVSDLAYNTAAQRALVLLPMTIPYFCFIG